MTTTIKRLDPDLVPTITPASKLMQALLALRAGEKAGKRHHEAVLAQGTEADQLRKLGLITIQLDAPRKRRSARLGSTVTTDLGLVLLAVIADIAEPGDVEIDFGAENNEYIVDIRPHIRDLRKMKMVLLNGSGYEPADETKISIKQ